ncbi:hypothetical protein SAMN05892877_103336 [Rhizobium subbaraonis]|uniref:Uncharacterized protein n=1 Tax=Rhizobium subbaraonis TaxID=908946 RepID=A0A285U4W8_9HYPH|nr:hypothetical protein SAMN05892877_103336 [Rhizobium subbaraonis]
MLRLGIRIGCDTHHANHDMRLVQMLRRGEALAVDLQCRQQHVGREMGGEGKGQAEHAGEMGGIMAGTEQPEGNIAVGARYGDDLLAGLDRTQQCHQIDHVLGKVVGRGLEIAAQGARGVHVGARRAAEPEVDAPGEERLEGAELFGDDQRRVVGQHDAAGADADRLRARSNMLDHQSGGRACDAAHAVVLGEPEALVAFLFRFLRQLPGIGQRLGDGAAFDDGRKIEDREARHDGPQCERI